MQFKHIIGQRELINQLTSIIDSGHVSHAQLFLGNSGYGTLPLAIAYAQYLGCQHRQHFDNPSEHDGLVADSCGECPNCKKYQQLVHPDLHLFFPSAINIGVKKDPSSKEFQSQFRDFLMQHNQYVTLSDWYEYLGIDNKQGIINVRDASDLLTALSLKSYEGGHKVVVIWMMERMNIQAANRLLKFIEEPSPNTLILMVSEKQDALLGTIISRTQPVKVGRIDDQSIVKAFEGQLTMAPEDFAIAAEGDYLQSKRILQHTEQEQRFAHLFVTWMRQLFKLNMASLSAWCEEMASMNREQQKQYLLYATEAVRACYLKTASGFTLNHRLQFGDEKFDASFPQFVTANNIEMLTEALDKTYYAIERNAFAKIAFMQLSFNISKALAKR